MQPNPITANEPTRRILVIANETVEGTALHEVVRFRARDAGAEVLVVAPALNSRLRHWLSDEDVARRNAEGRLVRCLERFANAGIDAHGVVGDADPLQAIADSLRSFDADELVIATHPESRSHWLSRNIVGRARARFELPVRHIVVDSGSGSRAPHSEFPGRSQPVLKSH
jgi:hypothetical protein